MSIDWLALDIIAGAAIIGYAIYQAADLISNKQLRNSPEYRKKYLACQEYVVYMREFAWLLNTEHEYKLKLKDKKDLSAEAKKDFRKAIRGSAQRRQELFKDLCDKYEGNIYNPLSLPPVDWPPDLLTQLRSLNDEADEIRNKYLDLEHGTNFSKQEESAT